MKRATIATVATLGLLLTGCPKPPTDLLKKAKAAIDALGLAKKCAPEAYRSALKMFEEAQEYNKKKAYREARRAAEAALKLAEKARLLAEASRKDCEKIAAADTLGKPPEVPGGGPPAPPTTGLTPGEVPGPPAGPVLERVVVYFDFDKYDVRPDGAKTLTEFAATLKDKPEVQLEIEGHCDARGSVEYNLALGERRARAVREFLARLGVAEKNITVISYGSEKPAMEGSTEEAHAKNRRAVVLRR